MRRCEEGGGERLWEVVGDTGRYGELWEDLGRSHLEILLNAFVSLARLRSSSSWLEPRYSGKCLISRASSPREQPTEGMPRCVRAWSTRSST